MSRKNKRKDIASKKLFSYVFMSIVFGALIGSLFVHVNSGHSMSSMEDKRDHFISLKEDIQHELMPHGMYRCCLEKACTYCIEKTPGHGEGAACDCLSDIMDGVHPCGECIGEIIEGHGNPLLSEYFARAIADEVGEEYIDTLREMISDKYDISVEDQL